MLRNLGDIKIESVFSMEFFKGKIRKKKSLVLISLVTSNMSMFAQSVYMHEAQEDSANSDPITLWGLLSFMFVAGIIYIIAQVIGDYNKKREKQKREEKYEEFHRQYTAKQRGGFVCPVCGKQVMDDNYTTNLRLFNGKVYRVKYCKSCSEKYDSYKREEARFLRNQNKELPTWLSIMIMVFLVGLGIYVLIRNCMRGDIFIGIWGMIMTPICVGAMIGWIIWIVQKLQEASKPTEPFKMPTFEHIQDCNAIE